MAKEEQLANPETESAVVPENDAQQAVFGSSDDFFSALDDDVNSMIIDPDEKQEVATPDKQSEEVTQTQVSDSTTETTDWEKRYKDSSREAQKMKSTLDEIKPFIPILDTMKSDPGLVDNVKDYLQNGGKTENVKEALNLPDDFEFDMDEAVANPQSDSARLFNHTIGGIVDQRVNQQLQTENQTRTEDADAEKRASEAQQFKKNTGMADEEFSDMMVWADDHRINLDDIYYLKNRGQVASNVAKATKDDMLNQMKNVREIPKSTSSVNSVSQETTDPDRQVLDALKGLDQGVDSLFSFDSE
jgi:hypothetical protein